MDRITEDFNKASNILLEAEIWVNKATAERRAIEKDIAFLSMIESNLEENIKILKRRRIVAVISDFKKATEDIATARVRLVFLKDSLDKYLKFEMNAQRRYEQAKFNYEKCFYLLHNVPNNVTEIDFSKGKNGRQK